VILLLLAVTLYPTALAIWISFQKTRFYALEGFVGLANYGAVLFSPQFIMNPSYGLLSYALDGLGIEPGLMLGDPGIALWLLVLVTAWWSFSYATVMMAAAVQSVPRELHEAVSIDGGGSVARLVHVTWPHLAPTMGSTALALSITYLTLITLIIVLT
jgi:multiple sugar transport system permease protein